MYSVVHMPLCPIMGSNEQKMYTKHANTQYATNISRTFQRTRASEGVLTNLMSTGDYLMLVMGNATLVPRTIQQIKTAIRS